MPTDTKNEIAAGASRQNEVAASLPNDMPVENAAGAASANVTLNKAKEASANTGSSGNSNNDNNPYARRPAERDLAPHERRITAEENIPGAPNPQVVQNLGDGGTMSGLFDAAGNALTIAVADATLNNNNRAGKAAKQPDNIVTRNVNGRDVRWPANTPAV